VAAAGRFVHKTRQAEDEVLVELRAIRSELAEMRNRKDQNPSG
jgi:hypothetical protein